VIQSFVDRFMAAKPALRERFTAKFPESYSDIVRAVVEVIGGDDCDAPDPERITEIDHGNYQGTLLYIVGAKGYQPSDYWAVSVSYGSCSGCDTLSALAPWYEEAPSDESIDGVVTLALHVVQSLRKIAGYDLEHAEAQTQKTAQVSP
jgi:hypothetical protein